MIGCALPMVMGSRLSRKMWLNSTAIISILGVVIEMTSAIGSHARYGQFIAGKIINSIAMGIACNIIPIYLSETAPTSARGFYINWYQAVQVAGAIIASGIVYAVEARPDKGAFLIPMGFQLVTPVIMLGVVYWIPESPRWLVWAGRELEAITEANALFLTPTNGFDAEAYCTTLVLAFQEERRLAVSTGWGDIFRMPDLRRMLIAIGIQALQQAQGSSYMLNYIASFLIGTGVTNVFPIILSLFCFYLFWICSGFFLPDLIGRRPVLIGSSVLCAIGLILVAILTSVYTDPSTSVQKASIGLIFVWYIGFGIQSPLTWIVSSEMAPTRNREKVLGMATFVGSGVGLLIVFVAPYMQDAGYGNLGSRIGFIWGSFSIINVAFAFFFVPEVKGYTLEQIDYLFEQRVPARKFKGYDFTEYLATVTPVDEVELSGAEGKKEAEAMA
ncbi:general substrate transporter [Naematelia encephala]|uniref:General substrate transporter n=1 Tax=Naematelia encephala TaxID=71784 RepID=A0A1Y2BKK4_9TREE|nr:general substrate transporter [Naematelia encephala]